MKRSLNTVLLLLTLILSTSISAQSSLSKEEAEIYTERFNQAGGTYQIQIIDSRERPTIEVSLIDKIEEARKENEIIYISLKENIRVKVLPLSIIEAENFVAVERIVFINSSEL